jgi:histone H3/H4
VAEIGQDYKTDLCCTAECMDCLQDAAEHILRAHFSGANKVALYGGRLGITVGDLQLSAPRGHRGHHERRW